MSNLFPGDTSTKKYEGVGGVSTPFLLFFFSSHLYGGAGASVPFTGPRGRSTTQHKRRNRIFFLSLCPSFPPSFSIGKLEIWGTEDAVSFRATVAKSHVPAPPAFSRRIFHFFPFLPQKFLRQDVGWTKGKIFFLAAHRGGEEFAVLSVFVSSFENTFYCTVDS